MNSSTKTKSASTSPLVKIATHILAILLITAAIVSLASCGATEATPSEVTTTFLTAIQENDTDTIKSVYEPGELSLFKLLFAITGDDETASADLEDLGPFQGIFESKITDFDFEVGEETISDDTATVEVTISTYAIGDAVSSALTEYLSQAFILAFSEDTTEEDLDNLFESILKSKTDAAAKTYTKTITIPLAKTDDGWKVSDLSGNEEFVNVMTGGLIDAVNSFNDLWSDDTDE